MGRVPEVLVGGCDDIVVLQFVDQMLSLHREQAKFVGSPWAALWPRHSLTIRLDPEDGGAMYLEADAFEDELEVTETIKVTEQIDTSTIIANTK